MCIKNTKVQRSQRKKQKIKQENRVSRKSWLGLPDGGTTTDLAFGSVRILVSFLLFLINEYWIIFLFNFNSEVTSVLISWNNAHNTTINMVLMYYHYVWSSMVINCSMTLWCTKTSINKGLAEGCNTLLFLNSFIYCFLSFSCFSKKLYYHVLFYLHQREIELFL